MNSKIFTILKVTLKKVQLIARTHFILMQITASFFYCQLFSEMLIGIKNLTSSSLNIFCESHFISRMQLMKDILRFGIK